MKILHLNLSVFSNKGGIEQVAKNWMYSLSKLTQKNNLDYVAFSLYDNSVDERYIDEKRFKFFNRKNIYFGINTIIQSLNKDVLIISHIHLSLFALLAKVLNPKLKVWVQLHGIEAWNISNKVQMLTLRLADKIFPVSSYTQNVLLKKFPDLSSKIEVLNNTLDPISYYHFSEKEYLNSRSKLNIEENKFILISVGRMRSDEAYKGYDRVMEALSKINISNIEFHLIGKTDEIELQRIIGLIEKYSLINIVKIIGFVDDETLINYYHASDLLVMPSVGEGFGLVYIDAMANGLPVIAGNQDGSVDAVCMLNPSVLINPYNNEELQIAILNSINNPATISDRLLMSNNYQMKFQPDALTARLRSLIN